jgi:hypothetical protein
MPSLRDILPFVPKHNTTADVLRGNMARKLSRFRLFRASFRNLRAVVLRNSAGKAPSRSYPLEIRQIAQIERATMSAKTDLARLFAFVGGDMPNEAVGVPSAREPGWSGAFSCPSMIEDPGARLSA